MQYIEDYSGEYVGEYTIKEEKLNALTHGIGTILALTALILLVTFASIYGGLLHIISFSIYGTTLVLLYLTSTLYHSFRSQRIKDILKILDHSAIYLLIAGTYTPFTLITIQGPVGWTVFGLVWGLALIGICLKIFLVKKHKILSTIFYILMGWMVIFAARPLIANLSFNGMAWLLAGGLLYTSGTFFYIRKKKIYNHAIWHLFVLAGSFCHFCAIFFYVLPQ